MFGLPSKEFFPKHSEVLQSMRHLLVPGQLQAMAEKLAEAARARMPTLLPHGKEVGTCMLLLQTLVHQGPLIRDAYHSSEMHAFLF